MNENERISKITVYLCSYVSPNFIFCYFCWFFPQIIFMIKNFLSQIQTCFYIFLYNWMQIYLLLYVDCKRNIEQCILMIEEKGKILYQFHCCVSVFESNSPFFYNYFHIYANKRISNFEHVKTKSHLFCDAYYRNHIAFQHAWLVLQVKVCNGISVLGPLKRSTASLTNASHASVTLCGIIKQILSLAFLSVNYFKEGEKIV